jgi:hypothetical protein
MLKVRFNGSMMKDIVNIASTLVDNLELRFNENKFIVQVVDPPHVVFLELIAEKDKFLIYEVEPVNRTILRDKKSVTVTEDRINIDLDMVRDIIRVAGDANGNIPWIEIRSIESKEKYGFNMEIEVPIPNTTWGNNIIISCKSEAIPYNPYVANIKLPVDVVFEPEHLARVVKAMESVSDYITIECRPDGMVEIYSVGDTKTISFIFGHVENCPPEASYISNFPMDYFTNIIRACRCMKMMSMDMGTDLPVVLKGRTQDGLDVQMMLAHRICSNEDD